MQLQQQQQQQQQPRQQQQQLQQYSMYIGTNNSINNATTTKYYKTCCCNQMRLVAYGSKVMVGACNLCTILVWSGCICVLPFLFFFEGAEYVW